MENLTKEELELIYKSFAEAKFTPGNSSAMIVAEGILKKIEVKLKELQSEKK